MAPTEGLSHAERRYRLGTNRQMRRNKPELAALCKEESAGPGNLVPKAATKWLAKRFVIASRMGDDVPIHAHGKGRRKQSLARAILNQAALYDVSHWRTSLVHGPASLITAFLTDHLSSTPAFTPSAPRRLEHEVLRSSCEDGGYVVDAWLVDSTGMPLGPCIVELHATQLPQASQAANPAAPPAQAMPSSNGQEASAAQATSDAHGSSSMHGAQALQPSTRDPQAPETCSLSLSVHPRIAEDAAALLQMAFGEVSAQGEQLLLPLSSCSRPAIPLLPRAISIEQHRHVDIDSFAQPRSPPHVALRNMCPAQRTPPGCSTRDT